LYKAKVYFLNFSEVKTPEPIVSEYLETDVISDKELVETLE
jgi:hypothetical protein